MPDEKKNRRQDQTQRVAECKEKKKKNKKAAKELFFLAPRHCRARAKGKSLLFLPTYSTAYPPYYTVINLRLHPGLVEGRVVDL